MAKIGSIIQEQRKKQEAYQEKRAAGYTKLGASKEAYPDDFCHIFLCQLVIGLLPQ